MNSWFRGRLAAEDFTGLMVRFCERSYCKAEDRQKASATVSAKCATLLTCPTCVLHHMTGGHS